MDGQLYEGRVGPSTGKALTGCFAPVAAAVVDHPEHPPGTGVGLCRHHLGDEAAEGVDARFLLAAPEDLGPVHVPGGEVLERAAPLVLELDSHVPARGGREGRVTTGSGLDGGLLVGRDDVVVVPKGLALPLPCVQVEDAARLGLKVGVAREDPRTPPPRLDRVFAEPAPDRLARDLGYDPPAHDFARYVGHVQAREGDLQPARQLAGQRLHGDNDLRGKRPGAGPPSGAPPGRQDLVRTSVFATCVIRRKTDTGSGAKRTTFRSYPDKVPTEIRMLLASTNDQWNNGSAGAARRRCPIGLRARLKSGVGSTRAPLIAL